MVEHGPLSPGTEMSALTALLRALFVLLVAGVVIGQIIAATDAALL